MHFVVYRYCCRGRYAVNIHLKCRGKDMKFDHDWRMVSLVEVRCTLRCAHVCRGVQRGVIEVCIEACACMSWCAMRCDWVVHWGVHVYVEVCIEVWLRCTLNYMLCRRTHFQRMEASMTFALRRKATDSGLDGWTRSTSITITLLQRQRSLSLTLMCNDNTEESLSEWVDS